MKVFIILCIIAVASAGYAPAITSKLVSTGHSTQSRSQDNAGNYAFAYTEQHADGGSSRQETGDPWSAWGSYSLNVGDGRQRLVKYVADGTGFRAAIATNEPGIAPANPADVALSAPGYAKTVEHVAAPAYGVDHAAPLAVATTGHYAGAPLAADHYAGVPFAAGHYAGAPLAAGHYAGAPLAAGYHGAIDHAAPAGY